MSVEKQSVDKLCAQQSNQRNYSTMKHRTLGLILLSIILQQIILTQAGDISSNNLESSSRKNELDCYRLKFILKSLTLRILHLESTAFGMSKSPFELAEIESWCGHGMSSQSETMAKRNFDEIDRSNFRGFAKKNFDEIDKVGFRGFMGRK